MKVKNNGNTMETNIPEYSLTKVFDVTIKIFIKNTVACKNALPYFCVPELIENNKWRA